MAKKLKAKPEKLGDVDEKDRQILNILAKNARTKLTSIARSVGLSVDSTKKRVDRLSREVVQRYTVQVHPEKVGLHLGAQVYIKLKTMEEKRLSELLSELGRNARVIDLMGMVGDFDIFIVYMAENMDEFDSFKKQVRSRFSDVIGDWKEVIVSKIYKLEEYRF